MGENIPGIEALMRWNFPDLPEDARIFSSMDDNDVLQVTIYWRPEPGAVKQRMDLALDLHLFSHVNATESFDAEAYDKYLDERFNGDLQYYV